MLHRSWEESNNTEILWICYTNVLEKNPNVIQAFMESVQIISRKILSSLLAKIKHWRTKYALPTKWRLTEVALPSNTCVFLVLWALLWNCSRLGHSLTCICHIFYAIYFIINLFGKISDLVPTQLIPDCLHLLVGSCASHLYPVLEKYVIKLPQLFNIKFQNML